MICPDKVSTQQWLEVHDAAHRAGLRSTTTIMFGHADDPRSWARHLIAPARAAEAHRRLHRVRPAALRAHGGADLPEGKRAAGPDLPRGDARPRRRPPRPPSRGSRTSRPPGSSSGLEGAQAALRAGANDLGGTLMNESISRAAGAAHGQEMPPERMEEAIRAIGRTPRQRTTLYGVPDPDRTRLSFGADADRRAAQPERERRAARSTAAPRPSRPRRRSGVVDSATR